ncbi:MAG: hypothetical protein QME14_05995, partial [Methanobacteriaceae archaeon]|nr:hypothetical protein [Methanobacteriaceae archaeon]
MKKILLISILIISCFLIVGTVSAADTPDGADITTYNSLMDESASMQEFQLSTDSKNDNDLINNQKNQTDDEDQIKDQVEESSNNNTISGIVLDCKTGNPFPGVTITLKSLTGIQLATSTTNENGEYLINFHSNQTIFDVSATSPGHGIITKRVNLTLNPEESKYTGTTNFQLAPQPLATLNTHGDVFINENFTFTIDFDNGSIDPLDVGFGPIVELIIPPEVTFNGATFLGINISTLDLGTFPASGIIVNPLTGQNVSGTEGYHLYVLIYPLGSFTPDQPTATLNVNAKLALDAELGVPLPIQVNPAFRFGSSPTGTTAIYGPSDTSNINPTVIRLSKEAILPEDETATGPNYPYIYRIILDIAEGATVTDIDVSDIIPRNLHFVEIVNSAGADLVTLPTETDRKLIFHFNSLTGIAGPDKIMEYRVYAPEFLEGIIPDTPVINPETGASVITDNEALVEGKHQTLYPPFDVISVSSGPVSDTVNLRSLAIQKSVADITSPSEVKPTDTLEYTLNFQVSDFFAIKDVIITDTLGDGQTFNSSFIPKLVLTIDGETINLDFDNTGLLPEFTAVFHPYIGVPDPAAGTTTLTFYLSNLLINRGYSGVLTGGLYDDRQVNKGATTGNITFQSTIDISYVNPASHPGGNMELGSGDPVSNNVVINGKLEHNDHPVSEASSAGVVIVRPGMEKNIYAINGSTIFDPSHKLAPGDTVTFSIWVLVPTTNLENFSITDYLPIPFLVATEVNPTIYTGPLTIPPAGRWMLGSQDTLSADVGLPTVSYNSTENTVIFYYGTINNPDQEQRIAHLLFTVTATNEPMDDELYLTNLAQMKYSNSLGEFSTVNAVEFLQTKEPFLVITKGVYETTGGGVIDPPNTDLPVRGDLNGADAGDVVTYQITVENQGSYFAYNVTVTEDVPTGIVPGSGTIISVTDGNGVPLTYTGDLFSTGGLRITTPLSPNDGIKGPPYGADTALIRYTFIIANNVYPLQEIENTAQVKEYYSSPTIDPDLNFVRNPDNYKDEALVTIASPTISKVLESTSEPTTTDLTIGETGVFRIDVTMPEGQTTNLTVVDTLPLGFNYDSFIGIDTSSFDGTLGTFTAPVVTTLPDGRVQVTFTFTGTTTVNPHPTPTTHLFRIRFQIKVADNLTYNPLSPYSQTKTNQASLSADEFSAINTSTNVTLVQPNLNITKSFNPTSQTPGGWVTITLTATNNGASPANDIIFTDQLNSLYFNFSTVTEGTTPPSFTFNYNGAGLVTYTGGPINPGQTRTFTFTVRLRDNAPTGSQVVNTANISYTSLPGIVGGERTYTGTTNANLNTTTASVTKTIVAHSEPATLTGATALMGEVLTYQITVNIPTGVTLSSQIRDTLPAEVGYITGTSLITRSSSSITATNFTFTQPPGTFESITPSPTTPLTYNLGDITNTGPAGTITIRFQVVVLNRVENQAGVTISNRGTFVFNTGQGTTETINSQFVNTTIQTPAIRITKDANPTNAQGGDTITFTLRLENQNQEYRNTAYDLQVTDPIISDYIFNPANVSWVITGTGVTVTNNSTPTLLDLYINKLAPGEYVDVTYTAQIIPNVNYGKTLLNTATFTGNSIPLPNGTTGETPGAPGSTTGARTGDSSQGTQNNIISTDTATVTTIAPTITKNVEGVKSVNRAIGHTATENIIVNVPIGTTSELRVTDVLPTGLEASNFNYNYSSGVTVQNDPPIVSQIGNTYTFNFGTVTSTQAGTITISYTALVQNILSNQNGVALTNTASVIYKNSSGDDVSGGSDTATVNVIEPQLQITKTPNKTNYTLGETVTYTLNITHTPTSTADAYDLEVRDILPVGITFESIVSLPAGWSADTSTPGLLIFNGPNLPLGSTASIIFNCSVDYDPSIAGTDILNPVTLTWASDGPSNPNRRTGEDGPGGLNDYYASGSSTIHIKKAEVTIEKTNNVGGKLNAGQNVTFTLTITNNGPDQATNLIVTDYLPVGLDFVSASDGGIYNPATRIITWPVVPTLNNGSSFTRTITATALPSAAGQDLVNVATVTYSEYPYTSTDTDTIHVNNAVLTIEKSADSLVY